MELTKTEILETPTTLQIERVDVPEWLEDGFVHGRELTGNERDEFDAWVHGRDGDLRGMRSKLVAMGMCNKSGETMGFTDAEVEQLGEKSGAALDRVFDVIQRLSGMDSKAAEKAEGN